VALSEGATQGAREDELALRETEGVCSCGRGDDGFAVAVAVAAGTALTDGVPNSAGRVRGVAWTPVISFACLKYST